MKKVDKRNFGDVAIFIIIVVILLLLFLPAVCVKAAQNPAPCAGFLTYGPADIPFSYDPNYCGDQIFGYFNILAGQKISCFVNVCDPQDIPVTVTFISPPAALVYDANTWSLEWETDISDVGLHYINAVADNGGIITTGTIPVNIEPDERPRFELIVPLVSE